jgi:hypothetical protein
MVSQVPESEGPGAPIKYWRVDRPRAGGVKLAQSADVYNPVGAHCGGGASTKREPEHDV